MRRLSVLLVASLFASCFACMNDRDTVLAEANRKPDVLWTIGGWFERNPPLYYQMRIDRVSSELQKNPVQPDLYDDVAVANERIGRHAEAISWMAKKRAVLERMGQKATPDHDWYRYYANLGTFHVHDWAANQDTHKIQELEQAQKDIAKAIELNSTAHFGREGYQLAAIEWLISLKTGKEKSSFAESTAFQDHAREDQRKAAEGLAGLIRLGGAFQSPDVYDALGSVLAGGYRTRAIARLAYARRDELIGQHFKAIGPINPNPADLDERDFADFMALRKASDAYDKERTDFMLARLKQGRHPDTDSHFWEGYVEPPKPEFTKDSIWDHVKKYGFAYTFAALTSIAILMKVLYDRKARLNKARLP